MPLTIDNLNPNVVSAQYAVRGPLVLLAQELEEQGKEIYYFNIGNPQQLGQPPLTFAREILSLVNYPKILNKNVSTLFANDNIQRAKEIMKLNPIGLGAYTQSAGMPFIRKEVASFINYRDNIPTSSKNIFLTDGASKGVDLVLNSLITNSNDGIMIPIPQYPLYSADITLFGGKQIQYFQDEENDWGISEEELENSISKALKNGIKPRAIVIINPNNPTGSLLSKENVKMILDFANKYNLSIIADEVYQENIYNPDDKFFSFAKIAFENEINLPIFSLHSTSKGFIGECGYRGGYLEIRNVNDDVILELLKVRSIGLCSGTSGQIMTYLMVSPPKKGDESFDLYISEKNLILSSLGRKAIQISNGLNNITGISCQTPKGAMYLFPKLLFPDNKNYNNKKRDFAFCERLVREEGIVTVPGSGFGQKQGTYHLRMTFLPPEEKIGEIINKFASVYDKFISSP